MEALTELRCGEAEKPFWAIFTICVCAVLLVPYTLLNVGLFTENDETITSFAGLLWFGWVMIAAAMVASFAYYVSRRYLRMHDLKSVHVLSLEDEPTSTSA